MANINELLEEKKALEAQIADKLKINPRDLVFEKQVTTDHANNKDTEFVPRPQTDLKSYTQEFNGLTDRLAKVKTAIIQFNASSLANKLQERDAVRKKITYLTSIKTSLPRDSTQSRKVTGQDREGRTTESVTVTVNPMFPVKDVEKQINELAAQERKLNTEIQKLNLNAEIKIE